MKLTWLALRSGWALLAFLTCFQPAWGKPVTPQQAEAAVRAWLAMDAQPLGAQVGREIAGKTESFAGGDGRLAYHVVYLKPSGFVIVPADDLAEPIVCFAAGGHYDPSDANPLGALVTGDLANRVQRAGETETAALMGEALPPEAVSARSKWTRLVEKEGGPVILGLSGISDVRVAPLVQSRWSQAEDNCYMDCYNYYTPNHYPCGCVATAQAQLMRFFEFPTAGVGTPCFSISVCGSSQTRCLRGGNGSGGPYAWASMVFDPDCSTTDAQRQAIGALCHDASVSVNMDYCYDGSGAYAVDAADSLKNTFDYGNAVKGYNNGSNIGSGLNGMLNPNLDAGYPALLGINTSTTGHAVVADGYGYQSTTLYHHLNLGWGGVSDAWYNLPNIDSSPYSYNTVSTCIYNVYTTGTGEIISGRVIDAAGVPISGATVSAMRSGGGTYVGTTGSTGIYALPHVPSASSYTVSAAAPGHVFASRPAGTGTSTDFEATSGNAWGVNFAATNCCAASGGCTEYISGVQVGSIDNTGTGCDGYKDYTYLSTNMYIGFSYPITVTNGSPRSGDQCGIWVDWSRDDDFGDANETIVVSGTPGSGPYTATLTPPAGASQGNARMRVRITRTGTVDPCGTTAYGEVEDYMINVMVCTLPGTPTGVSASDGTYCDKVRITWNTVSGASSYKIYRSTSNTQCPEPPLATGVTGTSYDDTSGSLGTIQYYYSVKATNICGDGPCSVTNAGQRSGPPEDFDLDCDVDDDDYDPFEACSTGPGIPVAVGCENRDLDGDADVDQSDFSIFQRCVNRAYDPGDPFCED